MYYDNVQQIFPKVNWQTLDRLYIPAGHYKLIHLGNLPDRDPSRRLVITNKGGQVHVGGFGHYYVISLNGGSNWFLTGRYDPVSKTGHTEYRGHADGTYANTRGVYGILINNDYSGDGASGMAVAGKATQFELEYLEVGEVNFAGMLIKSDGVADTHMEDVHIHDN